MRVVKDKMRGLLQQVTAVFKENAELAIFFFFLTTSLFLGDGKQPFVDAWWALGM